jgi:hypothetical protein
VSAQLLHAVLDPPLSSPVTGPLSCEVPPSPLEQLDAHCDEHAVSQRQLKTACSSLTAAVPAVVSQD